MKCPDCGAFMPNKSIACDCGWVRGNPLVPTQKAMTAAPPKCNFCHHANPAERMRHWIAEAAHLPALSAHLRAEFTDYYQRNKGELNLKLREAAEQRSRFTNKYADSSGRYLEPEDAFAMHYTRERQEGLNCVIAMQGDFERSLKAFVRDGDLGQRQGESVRQLKGRIEAFARTRRGKIGPLGAFLPKLG